MQPIQRAVVTVSAMISAFTLTTVSNLGSSVETVNAEVMGVIASSTRAGANFVPLVIPFNDYDNCATGFRFPETAQSSINRSLVTFLGVPFVVDSRTNPRALTIGQPVFYCTYTPMNPGVIHVGAKGSRLWLLAASDNNLPFPNTMFETTIYYADGANRSGEVQEVHTGLPGFIEFASWGYRSRPDLAVYRHDAYDPECCSGQGFVYVFFVELDSQREVSEVTILAPQTINTAYVYAVTLAP